LDDPFIETIKPAYINLLIAKCPTYKTLTVIFTVRVEASHPLTGHFLRERRFALIPFRFVFLKWGLLMFLFLCYPKIQNKVNKIG